MGNLTLFFAEFRKGIVIPQIGSLPGRPHQNKVWTVKANEDEAIC